MFCGILHRCTFTGRNLNFVQGAFNWLHDSQRNKLPSVLLTSKLRTSCKRDRKPFQYTEVFRESIENPESFWGERAEEIDWFKPYLRVLDNSNPPFTKW